MINCLAGEASLYTAQTFCLLLICALSQLFFACSCMAWVMGHCSHMWENAPASTYRGQKEWMKLKLSESKSSPTWWTSKQPIGPQITTVDTGDRSTYSCMSINFSTAGGHFKASFTPVCISRSLQYPSHSQTTPCSETRKLRNRRKAGTGTEEDHINYKGEVNAGKDHLNLFHVGLGFYQFLPKTDIGPSDSTPSDSLSPPGSVGTDEPMQLGCSHVSPQERQRKGTLARCPEIPKAWTPPPLNVGESDPNNLSTQRPSPPEGCAALIAGGYPHPRICGLWCRKFCQPELYYPDGDFCWAPSWAKGG